MQKNKGLSLIRTFKSLAQLIRLPNVLIIILTQLLLRYCIVLPHIYSDAPELISPLSDFLILVAITVLIATGGYVINDYFDVKIDAINRPDSVVVGRLISGRAAIKLHLILNGIGILSGFYLAWRVHAFSFGLIFPFISGLLWIYSARYKRALFWGNFIVATLSAFVILIVWLFEFFHLRMNAIHFANVLPDMRWVTTVIIGYAVFAFLVSMVREIVKDMEDTEGDVTVGCRTLPLVAGMKYTRYIVGVILMFNILLLGFAQSTLYRLGLHVAFWYFTFFVQTVSVYLLIKLFYAREKRDFHHLSSLCKLIMLAGILSLEVIYISN